MIKNITHQPGDPFNEPSHAARAYYYSDSLNTSKSMYIWRNNTKLDYMFNIEKQSSALPVGFVLPSQNLSPEVFDELFNWGGQLVYINLGLQLFEHSADWIDKAKSLFKWFDEQVEYAKTYKDNPRKLLDMLFGFFSALLINTIDTATIYAAVAGVFVNYVLNVITQTPPDFNSVAIREHFLRAGKNLAQGADFGKHAIYPDAFYLGKMIGDMLACYIGIVYSVQGFIKIISGLSASIGGIAGAGATGGISLVAVVGGLAVAVEGTVELAAAGVLVACAGSNFSSDYNKFKEEKDKPNEGAGNLPKPGSLSNVETRQWYLDQEAKIPQIIDKTKPLEQQAKQAFEFRNQIRTQARDAMSDRALAEKLFGTRPNMSWEQIVEKYTNRGFSGNALYQEIIEASQRSNAAVNEALKVFPNH